MSGKTTRKMKVAPFGEYSVPPGAEGFVVVIESSLIGPNGPIYIWPYEWREAARRAGVFLTREEAEASMGALQ